MTELKKLRIEKGLTTTGLGELLGISRPHASRLENAKLPVTAEMAVKIERRLGLSRAVLRPDLFVISGVANE